jgi:ubiquinone/menaquinone biosynthesis C-methylase UbiE
MSAVDSVEFREGQREQWDKAATGWRKWSELIDTATSRVSERMVELAGIEPGSRVLDVAAGYGEPSLSAARVAGPEGKVVATDISAEMLAYGRERAREAGLDKIEFVESDAAGLDFPERSFDAALSRFGIIFEPDAEDAASRVRGFLEPGGRMAIASWGTPEQVPFLAIPMQTAIQRLDAEPPPPGTPGPLSRPTPEALGGLLEGGGFSDIEVEEAEVTMEWESAEEFTTFVKEIAPPIRAIIDPHPQEVQDETWDAITEAVRAKAAEDGTISLTSLVLMACGRA